MRSLVSAISDLKIDMAYRAMWENGVDHHHRQIEEEVLGHCWGMLQVERRKMKIDPSWLVENLL